MDNESYSNVNMAGSLFGAASQMGAMMYGYMKLDDFARGTKIVEQAKHTASLTGKTLTEVAGDVRFNLNLPFSGKLDGKFGKKLLMSLIKKVVVLNFLTFLVLRELIVVLLMMLENIF